MAKNDEKIKVEGIVIECLPNTEFIILVPEMKNEESPDGMKIKAYLAGRMRMNFIKILPGDKVTVELTPYSPNRGRIIYRDK